MIAWYWVLVAFFVGVTFAVFTYEWLEDFWSNLAAGIAVVILYVPLLIYNVFFKLTIHHPISEARFNTIQTVYKARYKHLFGNFWVRCDFTDSLYQKILFIRVKKTLDK